MRDDFVEKKCLTHLRKIAAGTSEDLLRNLCLCLESSPFGGVDQDPVISPPRFLHDLVGDVLQSFLRVQSFNCPTITGRGCPPSYTNNTIFKIISLIKLSQYQVPGIVILYIIVLMLQLLPFIYSCRIWLDQLCLNV